MKPISDGDKIIVPLIDRLLGRTIGEDIVDADGKVVIVGGNGAFFHRLGKMGHVSFIGKELDDPVDVFVGENVVVGFFFEKLTGIDKLGFAVGFAFGQNQDVDGNRCAVKKIGRECNHGFDIIVVYQILADFLLRTATVEDAGKRNDGGAAAGGKVI